MPEDRLPKQGTAPNSAIVRLGTQEATFDPCEDLDHLCAMAFEEGNVGVHVGGKTIREVASIGFPTRSTNSRLLLISSVVLGPTNSYCGYLQIQLTQLYVTCLRPDSCKGARGLEKNSKGVTKSPSSPSVPLRRSMQCASRHGTYSGRWTK